MLRNFRYRSVTACLTLATMLALTGSVSKAAAESSPIGASGVVSWGLSQPFLTMKAKGVVEVNDPDKPTKLISDLKSTFRLGPNSNGLNLPNEDLKLRLQYEIVGPMYTVFVPGACFAQVGKGYQVQMFDVFNCGVSVQLHSSNGIVELLPYCERFDLRLAPGPGPKAEWDLNLSIEFAGTEKNPIAAIMGVLRSPATVRLRVGDDEGEVTIGRINFDGEKLIGGAFTGQQDSPCGLPGGPSREYGPCHLLPAGKRKTALATKGGDTLV